MPKQLNELKQNEKAYVESLGITDASMAQRLSKMGIFPGTKIRCIYQNQDHIVVCVFGSRLAIDNYLAEHIFVKETK